MGYSQIIEGTPEELALLLKSGAFAGQKLQLIVEEQKESINDPVLSKNIKNKGHLIEMLKAAMNSPIHAVTAQTWQDLHDRIDMRSLAKKP